MSSHKSSGFVYVDTDMKATHIRWIIMSYTMRGQTQARQPTLKQLPDFAQLQPRAQALHNEPQDLLPKFGFT